MQTKNSVYLGVSLDGFIATKNGGLDWLDMVPNPQGNDMGFAAFMNRIDALIMGRATFEVVDGFEGDWPYSKPVFVLSNKLRKLPVKYEEKAFLITGSPREILAELHGEGFRRLYVDGGHTIQQFLREDLIDEMILTQIPILLGDGIPLFGYLPKRLKFSLQSSSVYLKQLVQSHYERNREV